MAIWHREVSYLELLIPKLYFEAKTPVFTPFMYRSTDQPIFYFFNVVEVSECFWTVPGQSGAELPITEKFHINEVFYSYRKKSIPLVRGVKNFGSMDKNSICSVL